jgi:transposase
VHEATGSPIAAEALRRIAELYAIESIVRGRTADERRAVRQAYSRPLVDAMNPWLEKNSVAPRGRPRGADPLRSHPLAYSLPVPGRRAESISTTTLLIARSGPSDSAVRTICSRALTAAAAVSHGEFSFITAAKLNNVEPFAYRKDVLERMIEGHPMSRFDELLPWNWAPKPVSH